MCHPAVAAIASVAASVLSFAVQASQDQAQHHAHQAQQQRAQQLHERDRSTERFKAQVAKNNATTAKQLGEREIAQGKREERMLRRQASVDIGRRTALMAANGVALDSGSPLDILSDMAGETQSKALEVRHDARLAQWRRHREADAATQEGKLLTYQADATPAPIRTPSGYPGSILTRAPDMVRTVGSGLNTIFQ